jgi:TonB-dependent SusC/RagA subfamily outer membrane receptor
VAVEPTRNGRFPWVQPSNIESITVLKGSEASIYGVRGANGVIVIRTKNR